MAELEGLYVSLNADTGGLDRGMRSAEQSVDRAERSVTASLGRMDRALERVDRSTAAITQRFGQFAAIVGIGTLGAMAAKTIDYAEAWTQVGNRLRLVSQDAAQMKETQGQLFQAAQKAGVGMASVVDVYSRAAQAAGELGASQEQLTRFSGGVAQALAVSGTSAEAASGAMQQLGQLLGSTRVQAEEFNSILDGAPRVAKAVADGLTEAGGSVSRLKQLINDGKVTNKQFFDAFLGQIPKIQAEFDKTVPTIARSLATLDNAMGKLIGEANEAAGVTTTLARGLTALGNNLEQVVSVATEVALALGAIATARMVPAGLAGLTRAIDDQKVALYAKAVATVEAADAEKLAAAQALISTQRTQAAAVATAQAAQAEIGAKVAVASTASANLAAAEASLLQAKAKTSLTTNVYVLNRALAAEREAEAAVVMAREASIAADTEKAASLARLRAANLAAAAAGEAVAVADTHLTNASVGAQAASVALAQRVSLLSAAWGGVKAAGAGLLTLVGGPLGAALLAGGAAVYYLATRTSDAEKAQESYNRSLTEGRQRVQEMVTATREQANALLEKQRNEVAASQAAADAAAARVAALQSLIADARENADAGGTAGLFSSLFGNGDDGVARLEAQLAAARKAVAATAAALDAMNAVGQKTGDAVGAEMAAKLARGTSAFMQLSGAVGDALKSAGLMVQSGRLMTNEQAQTEKSVAALGQALQAGAGFLRTYGTDADQVGRIMAALKLKIDPVASAVADMNREIAQMGTAEGAARTALTLLQQANKERPANLPPLTTASPEYLQMLDKAKELETARVKAATDARAKVLDLDKQITQAQATGNATLAAELTRRKAVEELVARGVDRKVAEKSAEQDYAVAIAGTAAAAGQAAKEILLAADAQMVMAQAAGLGEAATRQATYATKLAQEAAKANGNVAAVQAANRREEAAAIVQIRNETVRGLELETANTNALTLAMAAGGEAVRVAQEQEYKLALIRKLGTDATITGTKAQQALNDAMDAYRNNRAANDNNRLEQARQAANDNLALAQRELDLMGQAEPVRQRAITSLQNQQEAARKVAELGEDGAKQWLAWQEQIADKRAYVDFLKSVQATAKEISGDISEALYDRLMDPSKATSIVDVFKAMFKRIAVAALETNIILPITTSIVGAVPGLFGISTPASAAGNAGQAAQAGGVSSGNLLSLGSKFIPSSWTSGITNAIDAWGASTLGIGSASVMPSTVLTGAHGMLTGGGAASVVPGQVAAGTGLTSYLGPLGIGAGVGGLFGPMLANGNKAMGGLLGAGSGAAAGALAGTFLFPGVGTLLGALLGGGGGLLGGLLGTQKPTVGPNSSAAVRYKDGQLQAGDYAADNGGNAEQARQWAEAAASAINSLTAVSGGKLAAGGNYDIGHIQYMEKTGKYTSEFANSSAEFDTAEAALNDLISRAFKGLAGNSSITGFSATVTKAMAGMTAKTADAMASVLQLAKGIDDATAGLDGMDTSLAGITASTRKATAAQFDSLKDSLKLATDNGIGDDYKALLTRQLRASLDVSTQSYTAMETAMAQLQGQTAATKQAIADLGLSMQGAEVQAAANARVIELQKTLVGGLDTAINEASGKGYRNQIQAAIDTRATNTRDLAALGLGPEKAWELYNAQVGGILNGLDADQMADVTARFGQSMASLRTAITDTTDTATAAANAAQAQQDREDLTVLALRGQGLTDQADDMERGLKNARKIKQAEAEGYGAADIAAIKYVQWLENVAVATDRATAALQKQVTADNARADIFTRAVAASGNSVWAATLRFDTDAAQQRQTAWNNGLRGQDLANLDTVLAAERGQTVFQAAQQAYLSEVDRQIQAINDNTQSARDVVSANSQFVQSVRQAAKDRLLNDAISPLSAKERLDEATRQVNDVYAKALNGDETARGQIVALLNTRDELSRGYNESTNFADFWDSQAKLEALGLTASDQLDSAEKAVKIADDQLKVLQQARTDAQNLGQRQLFSLDSLNATMQSAYNDWTVALNGLAPLLGQTGKPVAPDKGGTSAAQQAAQWMTQWFSEYDAYRARYNAGQLTEEQYQTQGAALFQGKVNQANALPLDPTIWDAFIRAAAAGSDDGRTAAWLRQVAHDKGVPGFAAGGIIPHIPGVSIPGVDSVPLIGMPGEGVVNLRGMGVLGADGLAALNAGRWPANDRWSGNITAFRSAGPSGTASLEQRLDRAVSVLERILAATEAGDADNAAATGEAVTAIAKLTRQIGRAAAPAGSRLRTSNG